MKSNTLVRNHWVEISFGWQRLAFKVSPASYFDDRAMIHLAFLWFNIFIHFPIRSGIDECEYPQYGFYFYAVDSKGWFDSFWWCWGRKCKSYPMPWQLEWVRTSNLLKDGFRWEHETPGNRKDFWKKDEWEPKLWVRRYHYKYTLKNGEVQDRTATVKVEEREWRPRWFKWTKLFALVTRSIDVEFDAEVGERSGSWKGGVLGCGWNMLPNETPEQTLRRMEKDRKM